jgi:hypothetical protein
VREYLSSLGFERPMAEVRRAVAFELFVKTGRIDTGIQMPERKLAREPGKPARDTLG